MSNSEFYPVPPNADDRIHIYRTLRRLRSSLFHVQAILATLEYDPDLELHHRTDVFRLSQFAQNWEELLNRTDATSELKQFQRREADRARGVVSLGRADFLASKPESLIGLRIIADEDA